MDDQDRRIILVVGVILIVVSIAYGSWMMAGVWAAITWFMLTQ